MNLMQFAATRHYLATGLPRNGYVLGLDPSQYGTILNASGLPASYLEQIAEVRDFRTGGVVAAQATGSLRPLALTCYAGEDHYLHSPGSAGNNASTPSIAALQGMVNFTLDACISMNDFTPASAQVVFSKYDISGDKREWRLDINALGNLVLYVSTDGTAGTTLSVPSSAVIPATDYGRIWVRVVRAGTVVRFYTSTAATASHDLTSWTQLGTDVALISAAATFASTATITTGSIAGRYYAARAYNAANGVGLQYEVDFRTQPHGVTSFTAATGQTVTINQSGVNSACLIGKTVMLFDGTDDVLNIGAAFLGAFNAKGYGLLSAYVHDTNPAGGATAHAAVSWSNGLASGSARIALVLSSSSVSVNRAAFRRLDADANVNVSVTSPVPRLVLSAQARWAAGFGDARRNGLDTASAALAGSGNASATNSLGASIGSQTTLYFPGHIGRIAVYNADQTAAELRRTEQWVASGYNIAIP